MRTRTALAGIQNKRTSLVMEWYGKTYAAALLTQPKIYNNKGNNDSVATPIVVYITMMHAYNKLLPQHKTLKEWRGNTVN